MIRFGGTFQPYPPVSLRLPLEGITFSDPVWGDPSTLSSGQPAAAPGGLFFLYYGEWGSPHIKMNPLSIRSGLPPVIRFGGTLQPYPPVSLRLPLEDYFFYITVNGVHLILKK